MLSVWDIIKGLFLGNYINGLNNLYILIMLWTVYHQWDGKARFKFNFYSHSVQLNLWLPGEVET